MPKKEPPKRQLPTVENALHNLAPGSSWSVKYESDNERDYKIVWLDKKHRQPTSLQIREELSRLQGIWDSETYKRNRAPEYPPVGDQLDALYHAGVFPEDMAKRIEEVKKKYPKPGG